MMFRKKKLKDGSRRKESISTAPLKRVRGLENRSEMLEMGGEVRRGGFAVFYLGPRRRGPENFQRG